MKTNVPVLIFFVTLPYISGDGCVQRKFDSNSIVCVCNKFNCDMLSAIEVLPKGQYVKYTSSLSGLRFHRELGLFENVESARGLYLEIVPHIQHQKIFGFGGTFTDSVGVNLNAISEDMQELIMRNFFGYEGLEYNMGRVPMAATDYSIGPYTYDDVYGDVDLKYFSLRWEDYIYKLPYIRIANYLANDQLQLIASPWTAPPWMKTNNNFAYFGQLRPEFYQAFADYYIKFLEAYEANGVKIWGITTGNEPFNGFIPFPLPTMGWITNNAVKWVSNNLGPTIRNSRYNDTKIIIHDDQKLFLPRIRQFMQSDLALKYVDGVAFHWYLNFITPKYFVNIAKTPKKDLFLMSTEASAGFARSRPVLLGDWGRAEEYIQDVMDDLQYDANGWIDWNLALNLEGGPVYTNFKNDATIIINITANEFYKQPMYYGLGHFSKFLPRNTVRVEQIFKPLNRTTISALSFKRPDNGIVVIVHNRGYRDEVLNIYDDKRGVLTSTIEKKSINTFLYW